MIEITPYQPDLEKIEFELRDKSPKIVRDRNEYHQILSDNFLTGRFGTLSDEGILRAMEAGLIKIWEPGDGFDILSRIQAVSIDLTLDNHFWTYRHSNVSELILGEHIDRIKSTNILDYDYVLDNEKFHFHPHMLAIAFTKQHLSLSNVIKGTLNGRSTAARLGLQNEQSADLIEPGFIGPIALEFSNANLVPVGVHVGEHIGSISFELLSSPSTRPRTQKTNSTSYANHQNSPFGFYKDAWVQKQNSTLNNQSNDHR